MLEALIPDATNQQATRDRLLPNLATIIESDDNHELHIMPVCDNQLPMQPMRKYIASAVSRNNRHSFHCDKSPIHLRHVASLATFLLRCFEKRC